jgi:hypothetical protein
MKIYRKTKSTQDIPIYLKILEVTQMQKTKKIFKTTHQSEEKKKYISCLLEETPRIMCQRVNHGCRPKFKVVQKNALD